jgi:hypothetical protein
MPSRSRLQWKPDARGYYTRQIGWKLSRTGKLQQHKFLLGKDRREAEIRERKLRELWDRYERTAGTSRPTWPEGLMVIAECVAKGSSEIVVQRLPGEMQSSYVNRILRMQSLYPVICFIAEDQAAFDVGREALQAFHDIAASAPAPAISSFPEMSMEQVRVWIEIQRLSEAAGLSGLLGIGAWSENPSPMNMSPFDRLGILKPDDPNSQTVTEEVARKLRDLNPPSPIRETTVRQNLTLHQALNRYQEYLHKEYFNHETGHVSPWGGIQIRQLTNLQRHHQDVPLSNLDAKSVDELIGYWRRRPCLLNSNQTMSPKSASNYLGTLVRFLNWLHTMQEFGWRKPQDFRDIDRRIRRLPSDHAKRSIEQVDTFSLGELRLLMRYGLPMDRLLLLLGLNCGFGRAEIGSLLVGEVHLRKAHSPREAEILGFPTTNTDSFIKRIRRKSGVYGEHILFPLTVTGLEWALDHRRRFPEFSASSKLIVNGRGVALDQLTKGSNANQMIPNQFARLLQRILDDGHEIRQLSFGKLRKTASDLIKRHSDGEIAGVFDCHGQPVKTDSLSDVYTNRPFGKVFRAIRAVESYLEPVFAEAGPNPFEPQSNFGKRGSRVAVT